MSHTQIIPPRPKPPEQRTISNLLHWFLAHARRWIPVLRWSVRHPRGGAALFWRLVNEPKGITLLVFAGYLVLTWGGASALLDPPNTVENAVGVVGMFLLSVSFVAGGLIGALTCLPGWNWLERGGVLLTGFAGLLYCGLALYLGATSSGNRDLQVSLILFAVLMLAGRALWIWNRPYARRRDENTDE